MPSHALISLRLVTTALVGLGAASANAQFLSNSDLFPVPGSSYVQTAPPSLLFGNGAAVSNFDISNFTSGIAPPTSGTVTSFFDVFCSITITPQGGSPTPLTGTGHAAANITFLSNVNGIRDFNTQMTQLDLNFGPALMRQDPTAPSLGHHQITDNGGGTFKINSFFDVFTDISLDGGATWVPSNGPMHLSGTPEPTTMVCLAGGLALIVRRRRRPA